jgi:hypothetical protein
MSLVGKFVFHMTEEFHQIGEIIEQVTPDIVMIRWQKMHNEPGVSPGNPSVLVSIQTMAERDEEGFNSWEFYDSRADVEAFHEWVCTPPDEEPSTKVVKLVN